MRIGAVLSAAFHIAIIVFAMTSFSNSSSFNVEIPPNIPVEILEIGRETNVTAAVEAEEVPEETIIEEVIPEVAVEELAAVQPEPQPAADEVDPEFSPFEEEVVEDVVEPEPEPEPEPPAPSVRPQPRPQPAPQRQEDNFLDSVAALLDRTPREQQETVIDPNAVISDRTQSQTSDRSRSAAGAGTGLTVSEIDALKSQIEACWNVPVGAQDAESLIIELRVFLSPSGSVQRTEILNRSRYNSDSFYRAATDSAVRAVERCENGTNFDGTPRRGYNLPRERYEDWRSVRLIFDPSEVL